MNVRAILPLMLAVSATPALGDAIYRHVDAQGHVIYTDQPPDGAEEVALPPMNTLPGARGGSATGTAPNGAAKPATGPAAPGYESLTIYGVTDGQDLVNPQDAITVSALPSPSLQPGHHVVLRHNGAEVARDQAWTIPRIDRGQHVFEAEVVDADGNVLIKATPVVIQVRRPSVLFPNRQK